MGDYCSVRLISADGQHLDLAAFHHPDPEARAMLERLHRTVVISIHEGWPGEVVRTGQPRLVHKVELENFRDIIKPEYWPYLERYDCGAAIIVPLRIGGRVTGIVSVARESASGPFKIEDQTFLQELADRAALAIENARLHQATVEAEDQAQRHAARMQALAEISQAMAAAQLDLQDILETTAHRVAELIGDNCSIRLLSADGQWLEIAAFHHTDPEARAMAAEVQAVRRLPAGQGYFGRVLQSGQPLFVPDASGEKIGSIYPATAPYYDRFRIRSFIIAPLRVQRRAVGTISISREQTEQPYTSEDRDFLQDLADRAVLAIENARLHRATVEAEERALHQATRTRALADISKTLAEVGFDLEGVMDKVARRVVELLGDSCAIRLLSEDGQSQILAAFHHHDPEACELMGARLGKVEPAGIGIVGFVIQRGRPLLIKKVSKRELRAVTNPTYQLYIERYGVSSVLLIPLSVREKVIGGIGILRDRGGRPYTVEDQAFLQEIADRAALAIENARLYRQVTEASRRKDEFLAMLGHELRNPLAAMLNAHRVQSAASEDATARQQAREVVERQLRHMTRMVDDLLDTSRITQGKITLKREPLDLARLVRETCEEFRATAEQNGLALKLDLSDGRYPVEGDRTRLAQMLTNLLVNAAKFTNAGGEITVGLRIEEWESGRVGERESGRVGERESGRAGEWGSGRVGERGSGRAGDESIRNPQSAVRNPQSAIRNPQS
jgi:GAF domain-containing protein